MSSLNIDITGDFNKKLDKIKSDVSAIVADELNAFGIETVAMAKTLAPVDEGFLRNSITFDKFPLAVEIIVAANYAAYLEFGTRAFAAAYVSSLPVEWQEFAAQFKGGGGGSFQEFVMRLTEWVHRKGLGAGGPGKPIGVTGTYSIKTGKRTGNKVTQESEDKSAAYRIALSILRKGIRPHPFLYPAIEVNKKILIDNLKAVLK
jgi:HK97 gp10 family phage protein